jgi:hypothetical protein
VEPYSDGKIAMIILRAMPHFLKTQYDFGHKAPPNIEYLQDALEKIKVAFPLGGQNGSSKNNAKGGNVFDD